MKRIPGNITASSSKGSWILSAFLHLAIILALLFTTGKGIGPETDNTPPAKIISVTPAAQLQEPAPLQKQDLTLGPGPLPVAKHDLSDFMAQAAGNISAITLEKPKESGKPADFRPIGPSRSSFFGLSGEGQRICYLVDISGSMIMAIEYIKKELQDSISQLAPDQYFQIVFYCNETPEVFAQGKLTRAGKTSRLRAIEYINTIDIRRISPGTESWRPLLNAIHAGFGSETFDHQSPNLIYLFTDGDFDADIITPVLATAQHNLKSPAPINVILCGSISNESKLQNLARQYKGKYQFLSDEDLVHPQKAKPALDPADLILPDM